MSQSRDIARVTTASRHMALVLALAGFAATALAQQQNPMEPGYVPGPPPGDAGMIGPGFSSPASGTNSPNGMAGPQPALPFPGARAPGDTGEPGVRTPPFFVRPRGGVEMTYTDNVLVTNTNPKSDFIVSPSAGLSAQAQTARTNLRFDGTISYDFYDKTTGFDGARYDAFGDLRTALYQQYLEFDARLATNQQQVTAFGPSPASDRSYGQNQAQVLNYGFTPIVRFRTGDFMNAEASYDFSAVNYFNTASSQLVSGFRDYLSHTGRVRFTSGPDFTVIGWEVDGSVQQQDQGSYISNYRSGSGSLTYLFRPQIQMVATVGYDDVQNPGFAGDATGIYATGGIRWALSRHTHISFDGGWRYREPYYAARVDYTRTQALQLHASYTQSISTPLSQLSQNLVTAVGNPTVPLPNALNTPVTNSLINPNYNPFGLSNIAYRLRTIDAGINGTLGRNTYALDLINERTQSGVFKGNDQRASATYSRQLALNLQLLLNGSYERVTGFNFFPGRIAKTIQGRGGFQYSLGQKTALSLTYYYQRIEAFPVDTRENAATLVLTRTF